MKRRLDHLPWPANRSPWAKLLALPCSTGEDFFEKTEKLFFLRVVEAKRSGSKTVGEASGGGVTTGTCLSSGGSLVDEAHGERSRVFVRSAKAMR